MNITRFAVLKPIPVLVITLVVVFAGILSYLTLGNSTLPEVNFGTYVVSTAYPGASAEVVEQQVTKKIEDTLSGTPNIRDISSMSQANFSAVTVTFDIAADKDKTQNEVQRRVTEVQTKLPKEAKAPRLIEFSPSQSSSIGFIFKSKDNNNQELLDFVQNKIEPALSRLDEVQQVRTAGLQTDEVIIAIRPQDLNRLGVSLGTLVEDIQGSQTLPVGVITNQNEQNQILLKTGFEAGNITQLVDKVKSKKVASNNGFVEIKDFADVYSHAVNKDIIFRTNGNTAVQVSLLKKTQASNTTLSKNARAEIEKAMKDAPKSIEQQVQFDEAKETEDSLNGVLESLAEGILLTGLVLLLFLKSPKSTLIVLLSIPTSLVVTFISMKLFGFNLNILSLLGVALCIGILVDDSIVVIENIYRKLGKTKDSKEAAVAGRSEIAGAAIAITLVDVAVFLPLVLLNGLIIQFFKQFAIVIVTATLASLLVSFTLTPLLSSILLNTKKESKVLKFIEAFLLFSIPLSIIGAISFKTMHRDIIEGILIALGVSFVIAIILAVTRLINKVVDYEKVYDIEGEEDGEALKILSWFEVILNGITTGYKKALTWAVSGWLPRLIIVGIVLASLVGSLIASASLKFEFIASSDNGISYLTVKLKENSLINSTDEVAKSIDKYITENKEKYHVKDFYTTLGRGSFQGSDNEISYQVDLGDPKDRKENSKVVINNLREAIEKDVKLPEGTKLLSAVESSGPPADADIVYSITGPSFEKLREIEGKLIEKLNTNKDLKDVRSSVSNQVLNTVITPKDTSQVSPLVGQSVVALNAGGFTAGEVLVGDENISVKLKTEGDKTINEIKSLPVGVGSNGLIKVEDAFDFQTANTFTQIERLNKNRVIQIYANLKEGKDTGSATQEVEAKIKEVKDELKLADTYKIEPQGNQRQFLESFALLGFGMLLSVIAIYIILAILYESLSAPLVIMLSLPTALIGAFTALLLFNKPLDLLAMIGLIILMGLVTKNGILLVDFILVARRKGAKLSEAIINAGELRLRPILMTTVSLIVGSIPLVLGSVASAELRQGVATVFIGGLTSSLFLTLFFIPVVYSIFGSIKEKLSRKSSVEPIITKRQLNKGK